MSAAVNVDRIRVEGRHRTDVGDIQALADSIAESGLLHPPVVTADLRLVAGERRLMAVRRLGWSEVAVTVVEHLDDAAALLRAERDENTCRKPMNASELYALGSALEELERPKARARQEAQDFGRNSGSTDPELGTPGRTYEVVAPAVGMSAPQWKRLKHIGERATVEKDEAAAETLARIDAGEESIAGGYRKLRQRDIVNAAPTKTEPKRAYAPVTERIERIAELAATGHRASQIATDLGVSVQYVRRIANKHDVLLPDTAMGKTRAIDRRHVVEQIVESLRNEALAMEMVDLGDPHEFVSPEEADEWAASLSQSLKSLNRLRSQLKEAARAAV